MRSLLIAVAVLTVSVPAQAQTSTPTLRGDIITAAAAEYARVINECGERASCLRAKVQEATANLAVTYHSVTDSLRSNSKQRAALQATQQAWALFVKANCAFIGSLANEPADALACQLHYTTTRAEELHTYIGWD
jgi:uncharacterized protein YecT (DUF1311 family)